MPMTPIDGHDHTLNPFEKSRLFKAASSLRKSEASSSPAEGKSAPASTAIKSVSTWPSRTGFAGGEISTRQILNLIQRYRLRNMTFEQLLDLPLSQLSPEEKTFVAYMRRNPDFFQEISSRGGEAPGTKAQDIKMAARLAGDLLTLSEEDKQYLHQTPLPSPASTRPSPAMTNRLQPSHLQTQDLLNTLGKLTPKGQQGVPFETLMAMPAVDSGLRGRDLEGLRFLQTTTVSKVLQKVVAPYNDIISPEVLRVLTSLLWNPSIYGSAPIVFFQSGPTHADMDGETIHLVDPVDDDKHERLDPTRQKPSLRLHAHHIHEILHNISDEGLATLEQLRQYKPRNEEEEKALHLLRQHNVFEALASLDQVPETLSDDDVKLALAEHALVLSDPYLVLVILP